MLIFHSRQLQGYQLLSDLSSDDGAASCRESNQTSSVSLPENRSGSRSRTPPLSPPLVRRRSPRSSPNSSIRSKVFRDVQDAVAGGAVAAHRSRHNGASSSIAVLSSSSLDREAPGAAEAPADESRPTAAILTDGIEDESSFTGYDSRDWSDCDGDEEDNAEVSEQEDEGGRREGGADGSGRAEAREGEEGSWWWSWTWGALPVRCGVLPAMFCTVHVIFLPRLTGW